MPQPLPPTLPCRRLWAAAEPQAVDAARMPLPGGKRATGRALRTDRRVGIERDGSESATRDHYRLVEYLATPGQTGTPSGLPTLRRNPSRRSPRRARPSPWRTCFLPLPQGS